MSSIKESLSKRRVYKRHFNSVRDKLNRTSNKIDVPEGLYEKCPNCTHTLLTEDIVNNKFKCNICDYHLKLSAFNRINLIVDKDTFREKGIGYKTVNPLNQEGYLEKINKLNRATSMEEAYIYGYSKINDNECVVGVLDSFFLMGSMGSVVGEKVTKSIEHAISQNLPLIIFNASGGARMQEGLFSLMQMAKTSAALSKLADSGNLFISVLTNPTYGGVTASFAMLGDIILAEPGAMVGFAGPRVIKDTIKKELPEGFQTSEFLKEKGFVDKVVNRSNLKSVLSRLLTMHKR